MSFWAKSGVGEGVDGWIDTPSTVVLKIVRVTQLILECSFTLHAFLSLLSLDFEKLFSFLCLNLDLVNLYYWSKEYRQKAPWPCLRFGYKKNRFYLFEWCTSGIGAHWVYSWISLSSVFGSLYSLLASFITMVVAWLLNVRRRESRMQQHYQPPAPFQGGAGLDSDRIVIG